jgi:hypothetical protein
MLAKVNGGGTGRMLSFRVCMLFLNVFGRLLLENIQVELLRGGPAAAYGLI